MNLTPSDMVNVILSTDEKGKELVHRFENEIKKTVLVAQIDFRDVQGEEIKIDDLCFKVKIER